MSEAIEPLPPIPESTRTIVVNTKKTNDYDFFIGRPSPYGNPFSFGSRETLIAQFEAYFLKRVEEDLTFREAVLKLKGKTLGCFCKPLPCHGDIIASWLDKMDDIR
jgi:hypothetical protein